MGSASRSMARSPRVALGRFLGTRRVAPSRPARTAAISGPVASLRHATAQAVASQGTGQIIG